MTKFLFSNSLSFIPAGSRLLRYAELPEDLLYWYPEVASPDDFFITEWGESYGYPSSDFRVSSIAYGDESSKPEELSYGNEEAEWTKIECQNKKRYEPFEMRFKAVQPEEANGFTGIEVKANDDWKPVGFEDLLDETIYKENVSKYGISPDELEPSQRKTIVKALMKHCNNLTYGEAQAIATIALHIARNAFENEDILFTPYFKQNANGGYSNDEILAIGLNEGPYWRIRECDLSDKTKSILLADSIEKGLIVLASHFAYYDDEDGEYGIDEFVDSTMFAIMGAE